MAGDPAKVDLLLVCDKVKVDPATGRTSAIGIWRRMRTTFPARTKLSVLAMFSGEFRPATISVSIVKADTGEQLSRDVKNVSPDPQGKSMKEWSSVSPEIKFPMPGFYAVKIDADGISPTSYAFELVEG